MMKLYLGAALLLSAPLIVGMDAKDSELTASQTSLEVTDFVVDRDLHDVLGIIEEDRKTLIARENFDEEAVLRTRSMTPKDIDTHGSAFIKVLRDQKNVLAFGIYQLEAPQKAEGFLMAVKRDSRGIGHATKLIVDGTLQARKNGVTTFSAMARAENEAFYARVAQNLKDHATFGIRPATPEEINNPKVKDIVRITLTFKDVKP